VVNETHTNSYTDPRLYYNSAPQSTTAENIVFDFRAEITTLAKIINNRLPVQQL
jgi:hypothetical protein